MNNIGDMGSVFKGIFFFFWVICYIVFYVDINCMFGCKFFSVFERVVVLDLVIIVLVIVW